MFTGRLRADNSFTARLKAGNRFAGRLGNAQMAIERNYDWHVGEAVTIALTSPAALTGQTLVFRARAGGHAGDVALTKTLGSGLTLTTPTLLTATFPAADSGSARTLHYSLSRTDPGSESVLAYGTITTSHPSA